MVAELAPDRPLVLVADDDPVVRRAVSRFLAPHYRVRLVEDGPAAIHAYAEEPPDLLLIDQRMPGMTGVDAVAEIRRAHERGPRPPALLMSGGQADELSRSISAGVTDFLAKPFLREELLGKIGELVAAFHLQRDVERQRAEIVALNARRELEAAAASAVLERMVSRGEFDPDRTRRLVVPADTFAGDVVFGATTAHGRYRWMVGDVTGHTLSSALVTIPISMVFYATARVGRSLPETIESLERELSSMLPVNMFCAAAVCELDRVNGRLYVWNGGLPEVIVRRARSNEVVRIESFDPPLAVARGITWTREIRVLDVAPGDRVLAFSDGLVETRDASREMLGVATALDVARSGAATDVFERLVARWREHAALGHDDDISLIEVTV